MSIADELITRGWTQRALMNDDGAVCLLGAMYCATNEHITTVDEMPRVDLLPGMYSVVKDAVRAAGGHSIPQWNNAPGRTFDEVLRVAKEADALLDARCD